MTRPGQVYSPLALHPQSPFLTWQRPTQEKARGQHHRPGLPSPTVLSCQRGWVQKTQRESSSSTEAPTAHIAPVYNPAAAQLGKKRAPASPCPSSLFPFNIIRPRPSSQNYTRSTNMETFPKELFSKHKPCFLLPPSASLRPQPSSHQAPPS